MNTCPAISTLADAVPRATLFFANARCLPCSRYHAPTPATRKEAVRYAALSMCGKRTSQEGLFRTCHQLTTTKRPLRTTTPSGVCIQLLAERIHEADSKVPSATMQVATK